MNVFREIFSHWEFLTVFMLMISLFTATKNLRNAAILRDLRILCLGNTQGNEESGNCEEMSVPLVVAHFRLTAY